MQNTCIHCGNIISKNRKFCNRNCYFSSDTFKQGITKPRPSIRGENNPNFGNKTRLDPVIAEKCRDACKKRGQSWTEKHKQEHRERMLGPVNKMRGKNHSDQTKESLSKIQRERYSSGRYRPNYSKISKAEKEIKLYLDSKGIEAVTQFWIPGVPFYYDFYLPKYNLIIEYNGDYWHANPKKFKSGELLNIANRGKLLVDDIWKRDLEKRKAVADRGYKFLCIWENEYKYRGYSILDENIIL